MTDARFDAVELSNFRLGVELCVNIETRLALLLNLLVRVGFTEYLVEFLQPEILLIRLIRLLN